MVQDEKKKLSFIESIYTFNHNFFLLDFENDGFQIMALLAKHIFRCFGKFSAVLANMF